MKEIFHISSSKITHVIHIGDKIIHVKEQVDLYENVLCSFPKNITILQTLIY
jgi:hypothetical protein